MNPDVFITMAFGGIAVLVALAGLLLVLPRQRREDAVVTEREARRASKNVPTRDVGEVTSRPA